MSAPLLLVFSHHRWDFVFQRPQQLMSRLAGRWRVLFVEEPLPTTGRAYLQARELAPLLTVLVPHVPPAASAPATADRLAPLLPLLPLLASYLRARGLQVDVAWLFTPASLPLAQALGAECLVYDCMTEPAAAAGAAGAADASPRQSEAALLEQAALVLTGGPSLYEARRARNPHVHCLPNAVDEQHFSPSHLQPDSEAARRAERLQGGLARPRLGYFGTIDERLDLALVATLADSRPDAAVVMVGPLLKLEPAALPRRPNLHWLGLQPYAVLPYLLAGWDLGLLPFAQNASTRSISPTQTLEYMAGEKPVVSTAVPDVQLLFGDVVAVAATPRAFVAACNSLLAEGGAARCRRAMEMLNRVWMHSWERSADAVHRLLLQALARQRARRLPRAVFTHPARG